MMRLTMATRRHCRMIPYVAMTTVFLLVMLHYTGLAPIGGLLYKSGRVQIHVVEEHHEALTYWFDAVKKGMIPPKGNILLHIDGHSDDAPPEFRKGYPKYRYPKTKQELTVMLQSNDMFIQAAILAGMFKKFIWIWPKWDKINHEENINVMVSEFGEYRLPGASEDVYCLCREMGKEGKHCFYLNRTAFEDSDGDLEDFEINSEQCQRKGQYEYEEIHEDEAVKKMESGTWFNPDDSIVLDIDEDYFGCENAGTSLVKSGAPWILVITLSGLIDSMICPHKTKDENKAENFLMPIIFEAIKHCKDKDVSCEDYQPEIQKYARKRLSSGLSHELSFLCSFNPQIMNQGMQLFVKHLVILNRQQLKTVASTGLCMMTTPKSSFFNMKTEPMSGSFHICTGFNSPNDTIVTYHHPDAAEVHKRIRTLHSILVEGKYPNVKLATICRSVRDGYTPRGHFHTIEKGILGALKTRLGQGKYDIYYDRDLLGGSNGWPDRHPIL